MREETLFHQALALSTPREREQFLAHACQGDARLEADVRALLVAHEESTGFLPPLVTAADDWFENGISFRDPPAQRVALDDETLHLPGATDVAGSQPRAPENPAQAAGAAPRHIGRFEICEQLGEGGMGTVYLAHDPELDRRIALKVPRLKGPDAEERFLREARAAAAVSHPNLCPVYDVGRADGILYLAMAYVPGSTLTQVLRQNGTLPPARAAAIAAGVARGMAEAHRHRVVHRDLKPGNILFDRTGEPIVTDFGLALRRCEPARGGSIEPFADPDLTQNLDPRLTRFGDLLGTPAYMSPEQVAGDQAQVGPPSDIYALGAILFEMLIGRPPIQGSSIADMLRKIPSEPVAPMPNVPAGLASICRRALSKDPDDRQPSMESFAEDLAGFEELCRIQRRRRIARAILAGTFLLCAAVIIYYQTNVGTIEIRLSEPAAKIALAIDGDSVQLTEGVHTTRLRAGAHGLVITGDDFETESKMFKVRRGDRLVWEVELKSNDRRALPPRRATLSIGDRDKLASLLAQGHKQLDDYRFEALKQTADKALQIDPESPGALALRSIVRINRNELEQALDDAEAALKLNAETRWALIARAYVHSENGEFDEAIADETAAIRLEPDQPRFWSNRSKSYMDRQDYEQAIADATRAIQLGFRSPDALICRGGAYAMSGNYQQALADYDQAASTAPNNWHVFDQRSSLHAKMGNHEAARKDWAKAKELEPALEIGDRPVFPDPPHAPERKQLTDAEMTALSASLAEAQLAWDSNRHADVASATDAAFRVDPTSGLARAWRARLLAADGRFEDSVNEATLAIRYDPTLHWSYTTRGVAKINLKNPAAGIADLTIAITLKPTDWVAWYNRGLAYMERGQFQQALSDYAEALRHWPNQPEAHVNRGVCHLSLGDYRAAIGEYDQAIEGQPANARWRLVRRAIRLKLGDLDGARQDQDEAFAIDPALKLLPEISLPPPAPLAKLDP